MEQAKFTQGEWLVLEHDDRVFVLADGALTVAEVTYQLLHAGVQGSSQLQNARLMAAAPDSHEANKASLLVLCALEKANDWHPNMAKDIAFAIEANRAAIAKALGS